MAPPLGIEPRPTPSEGSRFRVSRANHYTTGEYLLPTLKIKYLSRHIISNFSNPKSDV